METNRFVPALFTVLAVFGCAHAPRPTLGAPLAMQTDFDAPLLALEAAGTTVCALGYAQRVQCARADRAARAQGVVHDVLGTEDAVTLAVSSDRGCVATGAGEVLCFGLHDGVASAARPVVGVADAAEIALADELSCARGFDGDVTCWSDAHAPRTVAHLDGATSIVAADDGACALEANGRVRCWDEALDAREIEGVTDAVAIAAGADGTMAVGADGTLYALYRVDGARALPAIALGTVPGAIDVAVGERGGCVMRSSGVPACWSGDAWALVPALRLEGASSIAMGDGYACGLAGGAVRCERLASPDGAETASL